MAINPVKIDDAFSHCTQVTVEDIPAIVAAGYKTLINNRPDGEDGAGQPTTPALRTAAEAAGLYFVALPVIPNQINAEQVAEYHRLIASAPRPMLGFCRSGNRASTLYQRAQALSRDEGVQTREAASRFNALCQWFKSKCLIRRLWQKLKNH
jgi:sulfide:quinone oxidoreductase